MYVSSAPSADAALGLSQVSQVYSYYTSLALVLRTELWYTLGVLDSVVVCISERNGSLKPRVTYSSPVLECRIAMRSFEVF